MNFVAQASNDEQLNLLLDFVCKSINLKIELNSKLLRDILDVVEGLMRGILNSKGKYDHQSLKLNCLYLSEAAQEIHRVNTKTGTLKLTHREHAVPLKIIIKEIYLMRTVSPDQLRFFLESNLVSVLITKGEQQLVDSFDQCIKDRMPIDWNGKDVFARFDQVGIKVITRESKQLAA